MATVNPETHTLEFDHTDRLQRSPTIWEQQDQRIRESFSRMRSARPQPSGQDWWGGKPK